jgi:hypothetical protein
LNITLQGEFREDKFMQAMSGLKDAGDNGRGGVQRGKRGGTRGMLLISITKNPFQFGR